MEPEKNTLEWFYKLFDWAPNKILNIYLTGSRVYGTATEDSDWDYVAVVEAQYLPSQNLIEKGSSLLSFEDVLTSKRLPVLDSTASNNGRQCSSNITQQLSFVSTLLKSLS